MSPTAPPASPVDDDALRVVLFGLPAAGKSSLLGALGQAAVMQDHDLGGKLQASGPGLAALSRQLYEETPRRTPEEVVPYPVRYYPLQASGRSVAEAIDAVLLDCDGQVANDILQRRKALAEDSPDGTLAHEILEADALILVVDASAPPRQLEADFAEFGRLLEAIETGRGERVEVAGLPVFLVLTKCDLLAEKSDSAGSWMDRIEQRKGEVGEKFRAFLAEREGPPTPPAAGSKPPAAGSKPPEEPKASPFGKIDLHVWATAVRRPALAGSPARPREPYAVASLFRQCLSEAAKYRRRHERSQQRLTRLVVAASLLIGVMTVLTATLFVVNANTRVSMLQARVEDFQFLDRGGPAERLKGGVDQLRGKLERLQEIHNDPSFPRLRPPFRDFIDERIEELTAYIPYLEKLLEQRSLALLQTEDELDRTIERLRNDLAPPREEWTDTRAGLLQRERLESAEALRKAVLAVRNWFLDAGDRAGRLWTFADYPPPMPVVWPEWTSRVETLIDPTRLAPFREADSIPGAAGGTLTFATAFRFDQVIEARSAWESERLKLSRLLDVVSAVGLAPATRTRPALLSLSRGITLAECKTRLAELTAAYPEYATTFIRDTLPETILDRLRPTLRRQYEILLTPGRAEVLRQLRQGGKGAEETAARWEPVRAWLRKPVELTAWRELARVLLRLEDSSLVDPVQALATFLDQSQFTLDIRSVRLEIPESRGLHPRAEGRLIVHHPASMRQPALSLEVSGEPESDSLRRKVYTFRLVEGQRLTYHPGDKLWAELPLRGGTERLTWSQGRSQLFQFERLHNPPRLQSATATTLGEGRLLDDVRLILRPEEGVPTVPDLLPSVQLEN
ncbi:MAG: GTPase domain-containing protein [Gemmataceae bacterium]